METSKYRRRGQCHVSALCAVLTLGLMVFGGISPLRAGVDLSGCEDSFNQEVETVFDETLQTVAQARVSTRAGGYEIRVNPFDSYFGWETLRWLYLRQCAHINLDHDLIAIRANQGSLRQAHDADCWAISWLSDREGMSIREIRTIERDLERLDSRDWERFLGPRRSIDLSRCLKK